MAAAPAVPAPLRGAVLGLGMIGRHHARLLQSSPRVAFAGAVDPGGDRYGAVADRDAIFASVGELLERGRPEFAIVAVPTEEHLEVACELARAGVHILVEKPLAATSEEASAIIAAVREAGVHAAVGHVERFNPALLALRERRDEVGEAILIATERVGPFPDRVRDVGVVKDLATHDLDLVRWLGGAPVRTLAAQTAHRMGREHEDLVLVTGRLASDVPFNCIVDWLTPTKRRQSRILGERGMLVADTLTADLTLFRNGSVTSEWSSAQALRGVSEGDATRFALSRREPLLAELEAFCDLLAGDPDAVVVSLEEGLETVRCAEAVLDSARRGESVVAAAMRGGRRRPREGRPAPRGAARVRRARGHRLRHRSPRRRPGEPRAGALPRRGGPGGGAGRGRAGRAPARDAGHDGGRGRGPGSRRGGAAALRRRRRAARLGRPRRGGRRHRRRACERARPSRSRRPSPSGRRAPASRRRSRRASGLRAEEDFWIVFSPERVFSGRVLRDLATYPKLVGGLSERGEARGVDLYGAFLDADVWPMGSAEAAELAKLAETTYRDLNIGFANELARHADALGLDVDRVIAASNSQPFSHIHRPGVAVGGHCIPVYPRFYLAGDPGARLPAAAREINAAMPAYAVELLAGALGGIAGDRVLILGVTYRGGVKETAFSGALALRDELVARGATPVAADPLYDDAELAALGFTPWDGEPVAGAILQADHAEYRELRGPDVPGARAIVDGRGVLDPARFAVPVLRIGGGQAASAASSATTRSPARPSP